MQKLQQPPNFPRQIASFKKIATGMVEQTIRKIEEALEDKPAVSAQVRRSLAYAGKNSKTTMKTKGSMPVLTKTKAAKG